MEWIIVGDVHGATDMFARIPGAERAEGLIISGDLTNRGGVPEAEAVLTAALCANPRVLAQVGNMDQPLLTGHFASKGLNIHRQALQLAPGLALMGVGYSTTTPFGTPSEATEEEMAAWLTDTHAAAREIAGPEGRILAVIHNAPHGTRLDRLGNGVNVGSRAVRDFLEAAQPDICVCGHIHEGMGEESLGRCHVLNPGLFSEGGYVRVSLADGLLSAQLEKA